MPNKFEYVMILVSIVIGLGVTHVLSGFAKIQYRVAKKERIKISIAHLAFSLYILLWMLMFWWFEFKFNQIDDWTLNLYFFITFYATMLFMLSHILLPSSIDDITDFSEYFIQIKTWFYSLLILTISIDIFDAYLKGMDYLLNMNISAWVYFAITYMVSIIGLNTDNKNFHNSAGLIVCIVFLIVGFLGGYITLH